MGSRRLQPLPPRVSLLGGTVRALPPVPAAIQRSRSQESLAGTSLRPLSEPPPEARRIFSLDAYGSAYGGGRRMFLPPPPTAPHVARDSAGRDATPRRHSDNMSGTS